MPLIVPNLTCILVFLILLFCLNPEMLPSCLPNFLYYHFSLTGLLCFKNIFVHVRTQKTYSKSIFCFSKPPLHQGPSFSPSSLPIYTTSHRITVSQDQKGAGLMPGNFTKRQKCWCSFKISVRELTF